MTSDRDRLIELHNEAGVEWDYYIDECINNGEMPSKTYDEFHSDYLLANGVIVPPCKVGTEIFGVFDNDDEQRKEIYVGNILCYSLDENSLLWAKMRYENGLTYWHTIDDFGKTVFSTKEEAEKALEGYKENSQKEGKV